MRALRSILIRKIVITVLFICIPLIFFSSSLLESFGIQVGTSLLIFRLLGVAYLALCIGYFGGIKMIDCGRDASSIADMGIASNGLAGFVFVYFGVIGSWDSWNQFAKIYMWLLTFGAFYISTNLIMVRKKYLNKIYE